MARLPRFSPIGIPQHVIQRGNNRSNCFADDQDFSTYANWLRKYSQQKGVSIHAWVFMTNHVHLLVTPREENALSDMVQALGRRYVPYFNHKYGRTGTLWEGRFKSCLVQSEIYLLHCYRYIESNPVRAGMVDDPSEYAWSSYRCNALGIESDLCEPHEEYLKLGPGKRQRHDFYRSLFNFRTEGPLINEIRQSVNKGLAFGSVRFKEEIEHLYGRRVKPADMGRPKKV